MAEPAQRGGAAGATGGTAGTAGGTAGTAGGTAGAEGRHSRHRGAAQPAQKGGTTGTEVSGTSLEQLVSGEFLSINRQRK